MKNIFRFYSVLFTKNSVCFVFQESAEYVITQMLIELEMMDYPQTVLNC